MAHDALAITGLCIVTLKAPPGYTMIEKCADKPEEANLWNSGQLFSKKARRFLCITRQFPLDNGRLNNVLVGMVVIDEKDPAPDGYSLMNSTIDTQDVATCKKVIAVKMVPRHFAREAICDIVFHSKNRKLPAPYQAVGDIGGLLIGVRTAPVTQFGAMAPSSTNFVPMTYNGGMLPQQPGYMIQPTMIPSQTTMQQPLPYPVSPRTQLPPLGTSTTLDSASQGDFIGAAPSAAPIAAPSGPRLQHQTSQLGSVFKSGPLADVPFELNARLKEAGSFSQLCTPVNFRYRSAADLQRQYNYSFASEESAAARVVGQ